MDHRDRETAGMAVDSTHQFRLLRSLLDSVDYDSSFVRLPLARLGR